MQLTAIWHWYLPLCICSNFFLKLFLSIPFLYFSLIWYWSIRWNGGWWSACRSFTCSFNRCYIEGTNSLKICVYFYYPSSCTGRKQFLLKVLLSVLFHCFLVSSNWWVHFPTSVLLCFIKLVSTFPYICSICMFYVCVRVGFYGLTWEKVYVWEEVWSVHLLMAQFNILRWPCAVDKTLKFRYLPTN